MARTACGRSRSHGVARKVMSILARKVHFEGAEGPFGSVCALHVGGYQLVGAMVGVHDGILVGSAGFIVHGVVMNREACHLEVVYDGGVGWDAMGIAAGVEWLG